MTKLTRRCRKNLIFIMSFILIILIILAIYLVSNRKEPDAKIGNYEINIGVSVYHSATHTGFIEFSIEADNHAQKRFLDDSGNQYMLGLASDDQEIDSWVCEVTCSAGIESVKILYVYPDYDISTLKLIIKDVTNGNILESVPLEIDVKGESKEYKCTTANAVIRISASGMYVDKKNISSLMPEAFNVSSARVKCTDKTYVVNMATNTDIQSTDEYEAINPEVFAEDENTGCQIYAFDFPEWDSVESIELGNYVFL